MPAPDDIRTEVARDLEMVFQDESILGFQQAINQAWSYGVNATYRKVSNAVEDTRINHSRDARAYSSFPIINPGESHDPVVRGHRPVGEHSIAPMMATWQPAAAPIIGYKKPKRTYKAVEFQLDRAWDDKWAFNASYLWSKSEGNIEGPVNSDTGYADTNLVQFYDHPAVNERYGVLFNDHRHQFKLRGSYKLNEMWTFGATYSAISGGPITAFGVRWPNDNRSAGGPGEFSGGGSGWLCTANCASSEPARWCTRSGARSVACPGSRTWAPTVTFTPFADVDLKARFSVYNVLNDQTVVNVHSRYESTPGTRCPISDRAPCGNRRATCSWW